MKVIMLVTNDVARDGRVQKEAEALSLQHEVTIIGSGSDAATELLGRPYEVKLVFPSVDGKPLLPKWGTQKTPYLLRVLTNLTVTAHRQKKWNRICENGMRFPHYIERPEMEHAALTMMPDVVHCHDLDTLWVGYKIAQQAGAMLVYDSHEIFLSLHFLAPDAISMFSEIEAEIFPKIDGFVTVSPEVGAYLCEKYKSDIEPVVTYNGGTHIVEEARPLDGRIKLFFQGAFAHDRNNLELIEAMPELKEYATLTLQGWGEDKEPYEALIKKLHLEDSVFIIDPCGPLEVVDSASNYDIGVINSKCIDENFRHTLPNKLFDYMCAGLAVASTDLPPIKKILDSENCGITYEQKGVAHTASMLKELVMNPDKIMAMKQASIAAAPVYAWPAQAKKLQNLYAQLEVKRAKRK